MTVRNRYHRLLNIFIVKFSIVSKTNDDSGPCNRFSKISNSSRNIYGLC